MSTIALSPAYRPAGQLQLTRRGRAVVFALAMLVVLAVAVLFSARSAATMDPGAEVATERIVVAPGQTLWAIASEHAADGDVRGMVDQIEQLNALDTSMLYAGQELFVPAG